MCRLLRLIMSAILIYEALTYDTTPHLLTMDLTVYMLPTCLSTNPGEPASPGSGKTAGKTDGDGGGGGE